MQYVSKVPETKFKDIKAVRVNNEIEFIAKVEDKEILIKNNDIKHQLRNHSYFSKAVNGIKKFLLSKMGITEMLINFRKEYCHSIEAEKAFDAILEKLGISI